MPYADPKRQSAYQSRVMADRRREWLNQNGPCAACGSFDRLEVDHIDPGQKATHRVWSWSDARRAAELAKCQVLCARCHREKTSAALRKPLIHGAMRCYNSGCRCEACRAANAERVRRQPKRPVAAPTRRRNNPRITSPDRNQTVTEPRKAPPERPRFMSFAERWRARQAERAQRLTASPTSAPTDA